MPRSWIQSGALCALVVCFIAMAWSSAVQESPTFDEGYFVVSGYSNWLANDYRLHSGNGVVPQRWMSLPIVLAGEEFRFPDPEFIFQNFRVRDLAELSFYMIHVFFYQADNDVDLAMRYGRSFAIALSATALLLVFAWSRRLFGTAAGFVSLVLCAFSPNWLAHGRLMTADTTLTIALMAGMGALWSVWHRASVARVLASGLVLSVLAMSKLSGLEIIPLALAMLVPRLGSEQALVWQSNGRRFEFATRGARAAAIAGIAALQLAVVVPAIWLGYGFRFETEPPGAGGRSAIDASWASFSDDRNLALQTLDLARETRVLPEAYLHSLGYVLKNAEKGRRNFLRGEVRDEGSFEFLPTVVAIKTPLGLVALLALALAAAGRSLWRAREDLRVRAHSIDIAYRCTPLWVLIAGYSFFALTSNINLGLRHALPIFPPLFILAGASAVWLRERSAALGALVIASLAAFVVASVTTWPHYLAFFNASVGPEHAYRWVADSSLDWGQDLDGFARWHAREGFGEGGSNSTTPVYLAYFGMADPTQLPLRARHLPSFFDWPRRRMEWRDVSPGVHYEPGVYAISATMLQRVWQPHPGPWTPQREAAYRRARAALEAEGPLSEASANTLLLAPETRQPVLELRDLRFHRLSAYLLQREPDESIGYSILIYRLDAEDVASAVDGTGWLSPND